MIASTTTSPRPPVVDDVEPEPLPSNYLAYPRDRMDLPAEDLKERARDLGQYATGDSSETTTRRGVLTTNEAYYCDVNEPDYQGGETLIVKFTCHGDKTLPKIKDPHPVIEFLNAKDLDEHIMWGTVIGNTESIVSDTEQKLSGMIKFKMPEDAANLEAQFSYAKGYERVDMGKIR